MVELAGERLRYETTITNTTKQSEELTMDPNSLMRFMGAAGRSISIPEIGAAFEGGYYAGLFSLNGNGLATHALVVAPKDLGGQASSLRHKVTNNWTPGTLSEFDGVQNTNAMITAGIENHEAAEFCVNLSINGYTDWYLPALAELKIAYVNLKPSTTENATPFYGINNYSVPLQGEYLANDPTASISEPFLTGGLQSFTEATFWSSTETTGQPGSAKTISFSNGFENSASKTFAYSVRAFRRVPL